MDEATPVTGPEPERWLPVPGYPNYLVSDQGRVCKLLKPWPDEKGYLHISLYRDGNGRAGRKPYIHQIVAEAFIGPRPPGQEVLHGRNGNLDNRASQLRYDTHEANVKEQVLDGTRRSGESHQNSKLTMAIVGECRRRYASGVFLRVLAEEYGVALGTMQHAIEGKTWPTCPVPPVRGRKRGEDHKDAKLTEAVIRECYARWRAGEQVMAMCREIGVSHPALYHALTGRTWKHLKLDAVPVPVPEESFMSTLF